MNMTYSGFVKLGVLPKSHIIIIGGRNTTLKMDALDIVRHRLVIQFGALYSSIYTVMAPSNSASVESWQESVRGLDSCNNLGIFMVNNDSGGVTEAFLNNLKAQICVLSLDGYGIVPSHKATFINCGTARMNKWEIIELKLKSKGQTLQPGAKRILMDWPIEELIKLTWATPQIVITEDFVKMFMVSSSRSIFTLVENLLIHGKKKDVVKPMGFSDATAQELLGVLYHELHCLIIMKTINQSHAHTTAAKFGIPAFKVKHYRDLGKKMELKDLYRRMRIVVDLRLYYRGGSKEFLALLLSSW